MPESHDMHISFMQRCLDLAKWGLGHTCSNPLVGCVVVHENKIVAEGSHEFYGGPHAEVNALQNLNDPAVLNNCTVYVNLEPCSHHGKTPPCADLLISKGIRHVVIASEDPNPLVNGRGIQKLKAAGIKVETGILDQENRELNRRFFTFHEKKRPYIVLKWAESFSGFIAPKNHKGQFKITGQMSNETVHTHRAWEMGILVGRKTVENDDPHLNVRLTEGSNPIRLILDPHNRIQGWKNVMQDDAEVIFFTREVNAQEKNVKRVAITTENFLGGVLDYLYQHKIISIMVEGGAETLNSFIRQNLWDEALVFAADAEIEDGIPAPVLNGKCINQVHLDQDVFYTLRPH